MDTKSDFLTPSKVVSHNFYKHIFACQASKSEWIILVLIVSVKRSNYELLQEKKQAVDTQLVREDKSKEAFNLPWTGRETVWLMILLYIAI